MVLNDREKSAIKPKLNYLLMPEFMLQYKSYAKKIPIIFKEKI